jgi:hypothetical protein
MGPTPQEASVDGDAGDFLEEDPDDFFEEFVRCRSAQLFKLALLLTGQNRAEAEDLLQIALERAYRRRALLATDRTPEPYVLSAADGTNTVTLVPVPSPACHQAGTCLHFAPEQLPEQITLLAWVP